MASEITQVQLLTWFASAMRAIQQTQASGTTTNNTQMVTSCASQITADTGLTKQEQAMVTAVSSAVGATTPSSSIKGGTIG